jgi:hypothetical protein
MSYPQSILLLLFFAFGFQTAGCKESEQRSRLPSGGFWSLEIEEKFTAEQNLTESKIGYTLLEALKTEANMLENLPYRGDYLIVIITNPERRTKSVRVLSTHGMPNLPMSVLNSESTFDCGRFPILLRTEAFLQTNGGAPGQLICVSEKSVRRLYFNSGDIQMVEGTSHNSEKLLVVKPWKTEFRLN